MKNIKIPQRVGNSIVKHAYLELIVEALADRSVAHFTLDGYENDNDRVHFTYGGKKCILYGVHYTNPEDGILKLDVLATNDGVRDIWELPIDIRDMRFQTLDRIAYEIYDFCKDADWEDYEDVRKEYIAQGMDAYREFMS